MSEYGWLTPKVWPTWVKVVVAPFVPILALAAFILMFLGPLFIPPILADWLNSMQPGVGDVFYVGCFLVVSGVLGYTLLKDWP